MDAFAALYHGIVPAMATADLKMLQESLAEYQSLGFKRLEIAAQTTSVHKLRSDLASLGGVATGMSSMGPLIFSIHDSTDEEARQAIRAFGEKHAAVLISEAMGRNAGFDLSVPQ